MEEYESQYKEYKNSILQNRWVIETLRDKYRGSLNIEKDYINENGVLWKTGLLGAVCGYLIAFIPIENGNWILGIILFGGIMGSLIWARHIGAKFKKNLGETIFYAFRYHNHFKDRIQEDRDQEAKILMQDILKKFSSIRYRAKASMNNSNLDIEEAIALMRFIEGMDDFEKRYLDLSRYDGYVRSLKNDYDFNAEVQKRIEQ